MSICLSLSPSACLERSTSRPRSQRWSRPSAWSWSIWRHRPIIASAAFRRAPWALRDVFAIAPATAPRAVIFCAVGVATTHSTYSAASSAAASSAGAARSSASSATRATRSSLVNKIKNNRAAARARAAGRVTDANVASIT